YSAGGFKDTTRIAGSSPDMWTDICQMNKTALVGVIEGFQAELEAIKVDIEADNTELIKRSFERAKKVRDSLKK
ncbi:MAG: prephenate dehydrogenase/arogenate dehydrogenase family protein, partial [Deltaproteobacteria bacterium]|nr:prephenate dehydrogenase/arogenate dehydrogenase family protein [Deltaproteobacteria bacterium]